MTGRERQMVRYRESDPFTLTLRAFISTSWMGKTFKEGKPGKGMTVPGTRQGANEVREAGL